MFSSLPLKPCGLISLPFEEPAARGFRMIFSLNEGAWDMDPDEDGAFTLRTVYLLFKGEGSEMILSAISPILRPSFSAIYSKSASFSAAS
jgi:hypothetical protein